MKINLLWLNQFYWFEIKILFFPIGSKPIPIVADQIKLLNKAFIADHSTFTFPVWETITNLYDDH